MKRKIRKVILRYTRAARFTTGLRDGVRSIGVWKQILEELSVLEEQSALHRSVETNRASSFITIVMKCAPCGWGGILLILPRRTAYTVYMVESYRVGA